MKIFIDTADPAVIERFARMGLIAGVTTNPTLLVKQLSSEKSSAAGTPFERQKSVLKTICGISGFDVLAEPVSDEAERIESEARELCKISKSIVAKIPLTGEGLSAAAKLAKDKIRVAFTLVFSTEQAILAAAAGAVYICPFVGRLDDAGKNGVEVVADMAAVYRIAGIKTGIVAASIRNVAHVVGCARAGAAATVPPQIIDEMLKHELTAKGVEKFKADWAKVSG